MGFTGSPFLLDPESVPRVVSLSFRSSIVGKKLYVGNLTYNVNEADLEALFTPFGTVQSQPRSSWTGTRTAPRGSGSWRWTPRPRLRRPSRALNDQSMTDAG